MNISSSNIFLQTTMYQTYQNKTIRHYFQLLNLARGGFTLLMAHFLQNCQAN